jgi:hypothetical protein
MLCGGHLTLNNILASTNEKKAPYMETFLIKKL